MNCRDVEPRYDRSTYFLPIRKVRSIGSIVEKTLYHLDEVLLERLPLLRHGAYKFSSICKNKLK